MEEITATGSNAIISQTEDIFCNSFAFLESTQNFIHFEQKGQLHSLYILEVIDTDKCGYFNARKLLFWNTLRQ